MIWSDNMVIPKGAENLDEAHAWMDFVYRPEVAAKIASWVNFIPPVKGTREALLQIAEEIKAPDLAELADNPLIFPSQDILANTHIFRGMTEDEEREMEEAFQELIGA